MAQHAPPDERFRLSVKTLNAVSVIITCKPTDGRWLGWGRELIDSFYYKKKSITFPCNGVQAAGCKGGKATSKAYEEVTVLIEGR